MSREARDWAWDQARCRTITEPVDLLILQNLADVADENGENSCPSRRRLSEECLASERTITRRLATLVDRGLIGVSAAATRLRPTTYRLIGVREHAEAVRGISNGRLGRQSVSPKPLNDPDGETLGRHWGDTPVAETSDEFELEVKISSRADPLFSTLSVEEVFDQEAWEIYPRKVAKGDAKRAFVRACKKTPAETIIAGIRRFANDPNLPCGEESGFVPYMATWLNRESWHDEPLPPRRVNGVAVGPGPAPG